MTNRRHAPPRIYHVASRAVAAHASSTSQDPLEWRTLVQRAASLGFDHVLCGALWKADAADPFLIDDPHAFLASQPDDVPAMQAIGRMADEAREVGLSLWLDISMATALVGGRLASEHPEWYRPTYRGDPSLDPRLGSQAARTALLVRQADGGVAQELVDYWIDYLLSIAQAGVTGVRVHTPQCLSARAWESITAAVRESHSDFRFTAWTPGLGPAQLKCLDGAGFDAVYSSLPWWNFRDDWFVAEHERLGALANVIAPIASPDDPHPVSPGRAGLLRLMQCAVELGDGVLLPMQLDEAVVRPDQLDASIARLNMALARQPRAPRQLRQLASGTTPFTLIHRIEPGSSAVVLINPSPDTAAPLDWDLIRSRVGAGITDAAMRRVAELEPSAVLAVVQVPGKPVQTLRRKIGNARQREALDLAMQRPRVIIQDLQPSLPLRTHLVKRCTGEPVRVRANVFMDGHDVLAVRLLWRALDQAEWTEVEMLPLGNDAWEASFVPVREGRHEYTVEAWRDAFGTYRSELKKKHAAGLDVSLEIREGRDMVAAAGVALADDADVQTLLSDELLEAMKAADPRPFGTMLLPAQALNVERPAAGFASWYELFPRSQSDDPERHGNFRDVIAKLPYVRDMGFDVLYFPPIHPIGRRNRKGRNNSLTATDEDPGSPYAIGSEDGGHDAIHPELGTLEDFRELVRAAREHGLEIALDFAIQCSPDHPWLREHPDWFAWRADGSMRYAENPPKKYEDIVNVDFYGKPGKRGKPSGTPALWLALRDVVLFWADEGVRTFRVDNPHTKPLPFWEWMIAEVQARYPDTLFLSEAFTRPNMMYHLAKIGFSQSYTYFTWRNTRKEFEEYLTEISEPPVADFFRPNFFVNTPDINPVFLQTSGRPGFLIRAALAATMSGLWGVYSGFELCEGTPVPGKEEYLDSEKYEIRAWDWDRPGNIRAEIAQLNRIRRGNPALHSHRGIEFLPCSNPNVLFYSKSTPQRDNVLLIAVSLDPHNPQSAPVELPLWQFDLPDHGTLHVEDLVHEARFEWHGKNHVLHLHPGAPYGIWRVRRNP